MHLYILIVCTNRKRTGGTEEVLRTYLPKSKRILLLNKSKKCQTIYDNVFQHFNGYFFIYFVHY